MSQFAKAACPFCQRSNKNAAASLTACCGPGKNMDDVIREVGEDPNIRGVYTENMWLQYLI